MHGYCPIDYQKVGPGHITAFHEQINRSINERTRKTATLVVKLGICVKII